MSEERERRPKYNPADYAQLKTEAIAMDKQKLEEYYVKDKDRRYISCGEGWAIFFGVILGLAMLIGMIFCVAESTITNKISDNLVEVSEEVCPVLGSGYVSSKIINSDYGLTKIICNEFNSVPR